MGPGPYGAGGRGATRYFRKPLNKGCALNKASALNKHFEIREVTPLFLTPFLFLFLELLCFGGSFNGPGDQTLGPMGLLSLSKPA